MSRLASLALAVFVLICSSGAHAQSMDQRAEELRQKAEAAYFEMEMDDAISSLDQALSLCVMGCSDAMRAKLLVMRGAIVLVARNDEAKARKNFEDALALDPEVRPDPMLSNPKVDRVFEETRARGDEAPADEPDATEDLDAAEESAASETRVIRRKVKWHRVFLEAGYSLTMASAHENMRAASDPVIANPGDDPQLDAIPENDSYILSGTHGCSAPQGGYCVRKTEGLTALAHGLHIGGGYFISERFALGARLRWNPNAGEGTLSHFLLGVRAYYQLTEQKLRGFHASIYGGAMLGQIQVRPKQRPTLPGGDIDRPWARTGLGGLEIGAKLGHRFTRNFGIFGAPEFYTLFPDFSFGLQVTGGVEITFGEAEREVVETQTVAQSVLADEDGDGIPDDRDQCPDEPEDIDGYQDLDGCPDPDNDGDGIPDELDRCPMEPEDFDGFEDEDGCPERDNDGDGVPDEQDECPNEPGAGINKGCPIPDRDGDGVADRFDNCPDEPGSHENMGCPIPQLVQIEETRIRILDSIYFKRNKDVIERRSYELLDQLAKVINAHPEIAHVRIEGHTDETGSKTVNRQLSQKRADAVLRHLVRHGGVESHRLSAHGFGSDRPIVPNAQTEEEHAQNRRVEFVTLVE